MNQIHTVQRIDSFLLGVFLFLLSFCFSLSAYYLHLSTFHYLSFMAVLLSSFFLFWKLFLDFKVIFTSIWLRISIPLVLIVIYFSLRIAIHRFDFSVGDPSDYFLAGLCSVTYGQDIGFFLPLTASISGVGYKLFGLVNAPYINVIFLLPAIPLSYLLFRKFKINIFISLLLTLFVILLPLDIWLSRTSFSDPIWQLFLLMFTLLSSHILQKEKYSIKILGLLFFILALTPFLRGEAVLYFGLVIALSLFHLLKYHNLRYALYLMAGVIVTSLSIHTTLYIRANYLLNMQFSRIIPHITEIQLLTILYGASVGGFILLLALSFIKKRFKSFNISLIFVILSLLFKVIITYFYTQLKEQDFLSLLCLNEYGFAIGNFGLPLTLFIIAGMLILYYKAIKGDITALSLIFAYTIFYISFMMQKVTFYDAHAFLYYWNRYYLSMILLVHFIALGLALQSIYTYLQKWITSTYIKNIFIFSLLLGTALVSINLKMYPIVIKEVHQKNAYKLTPWIKNHIGTQPLAVVYDSSVIYQQNKGHIGVNHIKYLISRVFSVFKISAKGYEGVPPYRINKDLSLHINLSDRKYLLCVAKEPCQLNSEQFLAIDTLTLPLTWREHLGLSLDEKERKHLDLSLSHVNRWKLHFTLYSIQKKFEFNKTFLLDGTSNITKKMFQKEWYFTSQDTGVWMRSFHANIHLENTLVSRQPKSITLNYFVFNATKQNPKEVTFLCKGKILKKLLTTESTMKSLSLTLPNNISTQDAVDIQIKVSPSYTLPSKNPYSFYIRTLQIDN